MLQVQVEDGQRKRPNLFRIGLWSSGGPPSLPPSLHFGGQVAPAGGQDPVQKHDGISAKNAST